MAENVEWILGREERVVIGAANGHLQRWPYRVPPIINEEQTMLGQHLARANPCTQGHHPSSPRGSVASAMMLKSVPARIIVRVAPNVRKNE